MLVSIHVDEEKHKGHIAFSKEPSAELMLLLDKVFKAVDPKCTSSLITVEAKPNEVSSDNLSSEDSILGHVSELLNQRAAALSARSSL